MNAADARATGRRHSLAQVLDGLSVHPCNSVDWRAVTVSGASLDTRSLAAGEAYLAMPGRTSHGLQHVQRALEAGTVAVLSVPGAFAAHAGMTDRLAARGVPALEVEALADALSELGGRCFDAPDAAMRVVAVTGTDGKTSVCRFVADAFAALGEPAGYIGTLGWGMAGEGAAPLDATALTTPDALVLRRMLRALADAGARTVALEASSHGLAEGRLDGLVIDTAVLTNLGRDHLDYHGSEAAYAAAKSGLFDWPTLSSRVLNADDRLGQALAHRAEGSGTAALTTFSLASPVPGEGAGAGLHAYAIEPSSTGLRFELEERRAHGGRTRASVTSALFGVFNVQNLLACIGVLRSAGVAFERAAAVVSRLAPVAGRMQRVPGGSTAAPTVIVDFAHTPDALGAAIDAVRAHCPGRLCVVFGCGGDRDPGKRAPMARAAAAADRVIVTDDNPRTEASMDIIAMILEGFTDRSAVRVEPDRRAAIALALHDATAGDVVLIAGKGHEDYQLVGERRLPFSDVAVASDWLDADARRRVGGTVAAGECS